MSLLLGLLSSASVSSNLAFKDIPFRFCNSLTRLPNTLAIASISLTASSSPLTTLRYNSLKSSLEIRGFSTPIVRPLYTLSATL